MGRSTVESVMDTGTVSVRPPNETFKSVLPFFTGEMTSREIFASCGLARLNLARAVASRVTPSAYTASTTICCRDLAELRLISGGKQCSSDTGGDFFIEEHAPNRMPKTATMHADTNPARQKVTRRIF